MEAEKASKDATERVEEPAPVEGAHETPAEAPAPATADDAPMEEPADPQEAAGESPAKEPEAQQDPEAQAAKAQQPQRPLQHTFEAIKLGSLRLASIIKQRAAAARKAAPAEPLDAAPAEGAAADEAPAAGGAGGGGTAGGSAISKFWGLGAMARQTSRTLVQTATEGFKRLAVGDPLLALCRSEPPVPQLVLACCTALVATGGVSTPGIFKEDAAPEEVERLSASVAGGRPALLPPGTGPHVIAALLKHFLMGLQEPLLTYRLLPDWITVAGDLGQVEPLLARLPPASSNVLRLVLEVCHYVSANAADTEMDALALAQVLAPCVAWLPPALKPQKAPPAPAPAAAPAAGEGAQEEAAAAPPDTAAAEVEAAAAAAEAAGAGGEGGGQQVVPLEGDEHTAVVLVLEALINKFPQIYG